MAEENKDIVDRIYENFLMRDLTFAFGGGLLLASAKYAYDGNLICALNYVTKNVYVFITFLAISYFIGLVVQEGFLTVQEIVAKLLKTDKSLIKMDLHSVELMARIHEKYGSDPIRRIERTSYLKQVGAVIGLTSFISALILLFPLIKYHPIDNSIIYSSILFIISFVFILENRRKFAKQTDTLKEFEIP